MNLFCFGLNHRTAPIETRERFAGHAQTIARLRDLGCGEGMLLTTCNRVEIYGAAPMELEAIALAETLRSDAPDVSRSAPAGWIPASAGEVLSFYRHTGAECARHLFRVAAGMDSMVVGETEILGQSKRAYEGARARGEVGPLLHRLCQRAFRVAKLVRTKTSIARGSVSVGSVAVDLAEKIFGELRGRKVLVLGAGEMSEKTLRALAARGVSDLRVSNRTAAGAEALAAELHGFAIPFPHWLEQCREIDILISSTAAESHLLTPAILEPLLRERIDRPLFIIDIAVPRDIAPGVNEMDGVYLYDIDSLQSIANESLELRRREFTAAEAIVEEHVADFTRQIASSRDPSGKCREKTRIAPTLRASTS
ncbi:MAG: glutamyl-tRNA reductase [Verrucomicrobiota bacterium]|nr:glutamyl-tRNA reductase [Verrucomicrobiota bacterium]